MNAGNGAVDNGHGPDAALATARPLLLVRYRPGITAESGRTVHLVPVPEGGQPGALSALCGVLLRPEQVEQVNPGSTGAPCEGCALSHSLTLPTGEAAESGASGSAARSGTYPTEWNPQGGPAPAAAVYQRWGWPVALRRDQVWLALAAVAVALLIPSALAFQVVPILRTRRCPPLVFAHPATPDHQVLLGADPYPVPLGWPEGTHRIATQVLLPPTVTPQGALNWVLPPHPDGLRLTREIDILAAIRTALPAPSSDAPTTF